MKGKLFSIGILDYIYKRVGIYWVIYIVVLDYIQKSYIQWVIRLSYWKAEYLYKK